MNLQTFVNRDFGNVRVVVKDEEPWFVARDIASILGYKTLSKMYQRLDSDDKINIDPQSQQYQGLCHNGTTLESNKNIRKLMLINESGMYTAILGSQLSTAKDFKKWVTSEVLPSIRKHGAYMTSETIEKTLADPDFIIQLATELKEEKQKRIKVENQVKIQKPKVEMYQQLMDTDGLLNFIQVADAFGVCGRNTLMKTLRQEKILMENKNRKNIPYSQYIKNGYFEVVVRPRRTNEGVQEIATTLCTPKALKLIKKVIDKKRDLWQTSPSNNKTIG